MTAGVLIVGASQAGVQVAASLRDHGYDGPITLVGAEARQPYQRPPLSKAFLAGNADVAVDRQPRQIADGGLRSRCSSLEFIGALLLVTPARGLQHDPQG